LTEAISFFRYTSTFYIRIKLSKIAGHNYFVYQLKLPAIINLGIKQQIQEN